MYQNKQISKLTFKTKHIYVPIRLWQIPHTGMESKSTDNVEYEMVGTPDIMAWVTYSP